MARIPVAVVYDEATGNITFEIPRSTRAGDAVVTDRGGSLRLADHANDGADVTSILPSLVATAISTKRTLEIGGGQWSYNGSTISIPDGEFLAMAGDIAAKSRITINADAHLFTAAGRVGGLRFADFETVGGRGLLQQTYTGTDAAAGVLRSLTGVKVKGYTQRAIDVGASDSPNWQFRRCYFDAASASGTIHVALGGLANGTVFDGCEFGNAAVGVKVRNVNDVQFVNSSWYFTVDEDTNGRAMLWLTPSASDAVLYGQTLRVISCKMGNEHWGAGDRKIVVADAGVDGLPDLVNASSGRIYGMYVAGNKFTWANGNGGPLIFSTCPNIGYQSSVFGNTYYGDDLADIDVIEWLASLSITAQADEFFSLKSGSGFVRHGVGGDVAQAATTGWQSPD